MTYTLAISLILAPMLVACSSPRQPRYSTDYGIGPEVYQSKAAAEAALTDVKRKDSAGTSSDGKVRLLRAPMPSMPAEAIDAGLRDLVTVEILFNETGDVESVAPKNYKHPTLLEAVLKVVPDWKIAPRLEAGSRVKTTVRQSFRFDVQ